MTSSLLSMKSVFAPLATFFNSIRINSDGISIRIQLIKRTFFGSGTAALIISNNEMEDIMKIFNNLAEAIKNETKERNN